MARVSGICRASSNSAVTDCSVRLKTRARKLAEGRNQTAVALWGLLGRSISGKRRLEDDLRVHPNA